MSGIISAIFGRKDEKPAPVMRPASSTVQPAVPVVHPHLAFPHMFQSRAVPAYGPPPVPLTKKQRENAHAHWKAMKDRLDKTLDDARARRQNYGGG